MIHMFVQTPGLDWTNPKSPVFSAVACAFRDYPMKCLKCLSGFVKIGFLGRAPNYVRKVGTNHSRFSPSTSFDSMPVRTTPAWPRVPAYRQKPMASTGLLKSLGETAVSRLKWKEPQTEINQALRIHRTARFNVETNAKKKPNEHNSEAGHSLWNHTNDSVVRGFRCLVVLWFAEVVAVSKKKKDTPVKVTFIGYDKCLAAYYIQQPRWFICLAGLGMLTYIQDVLSNGLYESCYIHYINWDYVKKSNIHLSWGRYPSPRNRVWSILYSLHSIHSILSTS